MLILFSNRLIFKYLKFNNLEIINTAIYIIIPCIPKN